MALSTCAEVYRPRFEAMALQPRAVFRLLCCIRCPHSTLMLSELCVTVLV